MNDQNVPESVISIVAWAPAATRMDILDSYLSARGLDARMIPDDVRAQLRAKDRASIRLALLQVVRRVMETHTSNT